MYGSRRFISRETIAAHVVLFVRNPSEPEGEARLTGSADTGGLIGRDEAAMTTPNNQGSIAAS